MKIVSADYVKSFVRIEDFDLYPKPSIAFIGRSNVGKSSLINSLLGRRNLVKTSATPGKTQLINYFEINQKFYFIDLPGYGFAKVSKEVRKNWLHMMDDFFHECPELRLIVQIVDIRHKPSKDDIEFRNFLADFEVPSIVVANKLDKLKKNEVQKSLKVIKQTLSLEAHPQSYSAVSHMGKDDLTTKLNSFLKTD